MSGTIAAVPVSDLTSGVQLFRCVPYSCTMLARSCVVRQAQADSDFPPVSLLLCKGCALGAEVKARAGGDVDVDPDAAARASRKHVVGLPHKAARKAPVLAPLPAASLPAPEPAPEPQQIVTAPPAPTKEESMPNFVDLTGKPIAGATVVGRAASSGKGASWRVKHACGHEAIITAAMLVYYAKTGSNLRCKESACRTPLKTELAKTPRRSPTAEAPAARAGAPRQKRQPPAPVVAPRSASTHTHEFPLRRDFTARLELPSDLSKTDVARLSRWLDVIAFEVE